MPWVFSHYELQPAKAAYERGETKARISPDLGRSQVVVGLSDRGLHFPQGRVLPWEEVETVLAHPTLCYAWEAEGLVPLQVYSWLTGRTAQLYPTGHAPTVLLSGIAMHRVRGSRPWEDTQAKIRAARPRGRVLDTCAGLGYTAIQAADQGAWVLSVELDPAVLALARKNPWSREWFTNPRIVGVQGDVAQLIQGMPAEHFHVVLHDPPQFALAGELYGLPFYRELYRVLRPGGRLFHYIGNPETRMGRNVTRGVVRRLQEAGFREVRRVPWAFGVLARKP